MLSRWRPEHIGRRAPVVASQCFPGSQGAVGDISTVPGVLMITCSEASLNITGRSLHAESSRDAACGTRVSRVGGPDITAAANDVADLSCRSAVGRKVERPTA